MVDEHLLGCRQLLLLSDLAVGATSTETATFDLSDPSYNGIPDGTYYIGAYADYDDNSI